MILSWHHRLFAVVMFWTALTTIFAWLPLVRIIARPEGYQWGILGLSGSGTEGPYWIFVPLTCHAVTLLFSAFRAPRALFYPLVILWHLMATAVIVTGVLQGGRGATFQGQGLHFSVPMWLLVVPFAAATIAVVAWAILDHRAGGGPTTVPWARANTRRLGLSVGLLAAALLLFRAGTNYNWVTAVAIVTTIAHWSVMIQAFTPLSAQRDEHPVVRA
jgi:hypothetical protein